MNAIFSYVFVVATALLLFSNPDLFLQSVLNGASKGAALCLALVSSYALWLGLISVWEKSGVAAKISKVLSPLVKKLFKTEDAETVSAICMNLSVNLLGVGGTATPYGVKACKLLDKSENAEYSSALFFVVNASSVQLLPTALVGVRASMGSLSPADIVFPSILTTAFSTLAAVLLTKAYFSLLEKRKPREKNKNAIKRFGSRIRGAGTR